MQSPGLGAPSSVQPLQDSPLASPASRASILIHPFHPFPAPTPLNTLFISYVHFPTGPTFKSQERCGGQNCTKNGTQSKGSGSEPVKPQLCHVTLVLRHSVSTRWGPWEWTLLAVKSGVWEAIARAYNKLEFSLPHFIPSCISGISLPFPLSCLILGRLGAGSFLDPFAVGSLEPSKMFLLESCPCGLS